MTLRISLHQCRSEFFTWHPEYPCYAERMQAMARHVQLAVHLIDDMMLVPIKC
jgi:hypothetical protein